MAVPFSNIGVWEMKRLYAGVLFLSTGQPRTSWTVGNVGLASPGPHTANSGYGVCLEILQIQFSTKLLKKDHAAIVSQTRIFDGKTYFSDAFWHTSQSSLKVRLMKQAILTSDYNRFSSTYKKFQVLKSAYSPFFQDQLLLSFS